MKKILVAVLLTLPVVAFADNHTHTGPMETCMKAALAKYPGKVTSLEAEIENGKPIYEFDIKIKGGKEVEVECDAATGTLLEEEMDVSRKDPAFKSKAKISMKEAKKIALAKYPGEVVTVEYELEDGSPIYEFDIKTADGKELEVEVSAVTGEIGETEEEVYEIGKD
jgi:uncharacterized membrane protein YkoI